MTLWSQLSISPTLAIAFVRCNWQNTFEHDHSQLICAVEKMPKFVRGQPLTECIAAYLNPYDFLLWLSEEIESRGYDQLEKEWAIPIGVIFNLLFLVSRANTSARSSSYDDVFGDNAGFGWRAWLVRGRQHL